MAISAEYILSMLNPYKGFSTAESAKMGIAAGQAATDARERRLGREQQKELALADDARAGQYLDLQTKQAQHNMDQDTNDRRMKAFGAFQAAVESGDVEGAKLAANALRAFGVDVQEYGAGEQTASAAVESPAPAAPSAMGAMAQQSPTARVAQGQARAQMNSADQRTADELDALAREATVDDGAGSPGYSMDAMDAPTVRPGGARVRAYGTGGRSSPAMASLQAEVDRNPVNDPIHEHVPIQIVGQQQEFEMSGGRLSGKLPDELSAIDRNARMEEMGLNPRLSDSAAIEALIGGDPMMAKMMRSMPQSGAQELTESPPTGPTGPRPGPARTQYIEGQEPAAAGEASPQQGLIRGYRISFNGQTIDVDPEQVLERQRTRVAVALGPLLKNASTPAEKRAAQMAIESAVGAVGTLSPQQAVEFGVKIYQDPLDRSAKETRARLIGGKGVAAGEGFGGTPGLTKEGNQVQSGLYDDTSNFLGQFESTHKVPLAREAIKNGDKAIALLSSDNPISQRAALTSTMKTWFSSVTSNTELAFVNQSAGMLNQLEMELNKYVDQGRLPADFLFKLKSSVAAMQSQFRDHMHELGVKAASEYLSNDTLTSRMSPDQAQNQSDMVFGRFTGVYPKTYRPRGQGGDGGQAPAKAAPKPKADAPKSANDRARRLLGK